MVMKNLFLSLIFVLAGSVCIFAQQPTPTPSPSPTLDDQSVTDTNPIKQKRRRAARPAEYQGSGILQLEYGYDGDFRATGTPDAQALTVALNYAVTDKLQLEFANDNFVTQSDSSRNRVNGIGNTYLGFQYTLQSEAENRPAFAFSYQVTLPTGSQSKGLSNGRDWHSLTGIISKEIKDTDINFNAALLLNGRQGLKSYDKGVALALSFSRELKKGFGLQWEVFGQTLDASQPKGIFASTTVTYQRDLQSQFDWGVRVGLTRNAPRFGIFAGWTFSFPKFKD